MARFTSITSALIALVALSLPKIDEPGAPVLVTLQAALVLACGLILHAGSALGRGAPGPH